MPSPHAIIIDDRSVNIEVLDLLLAREGVTATAVQSPERLAEIINQTERIDVIFLDLEIPSLSYYHLLHKLKAMPQLKGVPVVAYTVHISEIEVARQAGFNGFLGKPLNISKFPGHLQRILNGEEVWTGYYGEELDEYANRFSNNF